MHATSHDSFPWYVLTTLAGVVAALLVYVVTNDVVWTLVTLLLTVVVVRHLARRDVAP